MPRIVQNGHLTLHYLGGQKGLQNSATCHNGEPRLCFNPGISVGASVSNKWHIQHWNQRIQKLFSWNKEIVLDFLEVQAKSSLSSDTNDKVRAEVPQCPAPPSGQKKYSTTRNATASVLNASMSVPYRWSTPINWSYAQCSRIILLIKGNHSLYKTNSVIVCCTELALLELTQLIQHESGACTNRCGLYPGHF